MPRKKETLTFATKLLGIAEDAKQQLTEVEVLEAFLNVTRFLREGYEPKRLAQAIAEEIETATKRNPNLIN